MAEQPQWTRDEVKGLLERGTIADLERLIANPGRKNRAEFASSYAISALKSIADSELLPDDIRSLVQQVLELYETASDPFLGMNLPDQKQRQPDKPRADIELNASREELRNRPRCLGLMLDYKHAPQW
jgi:hypothetical protein